MAKAAEIASRIEEKAELIGGIKVVRFTQPVDPQLLRNVALLVARKAENLVVAAAYEFAGKPNLLLMYSDDLVAKGRNAGKDIREAARFIQGGGGGQPGLATAGGRNPEGLDQALEKMVETATA